MKIIVPVKRVIDANVHVRVKPDNSGVVTDNVKTAMNPFCRIALEEALRIRENDREGEVIVATVGDQQCEEVLRSGLAMGADRAILLTTSIDVQPIAVARLLSVLANKEKPDLFLLGKQSIDGDHNQTGQMLSAMLGWSQGTFVSKIGFSGNNLSVMREVDGGLENLELTMPAVITADLRLNEPRYVNLSDMMKARNKPLDKVTAGELVPDIRPTIAILGMEEAQSSRKGIRVADVKELLDKLRFEAGVI
jgi:electron transfer flavoprotein beta subunit